MDENHMLVRVLQWSFVFSGGIAWIDRGTFLHLKASGSTHGVVRGGARTRAPELLLELVRHADEGDVTERVGVPCG